MPIPNPKINEPEEEYVSRCSEFLQNEGMENKQALAICYSNFYKENQMNKNLEQYRVYEQTKKFQEQEINSVTPEELSQCMAELKGNMPGGTYTSPAFEKVCIGRILAKKNQATNSGL
jgi:hypothetical protein